MKRIAILTVIATLLLSGCTSYYKVVDPSTNKTYYTTKYEQNRSGAVEFKDQATGSTVTVQNSEISEISEATFKQGGGTK